MKTFLAALLVILTLRPAFSQQKIGTFQSITATQAIGDKVFFAASNEQYGSELFVSEASSGKFSLVKDINPGRNASPANFTVLNNELFFTAYSSSGSGVWKTDGTPEGTQLVYGVANTDPGNLTAFKGKLYFTTSTGAIMRTDGSPGSTEVFYQADFTWGRIMTFQKTNDYLYFTANGQTIFRDDGSSRFEFIGPLSWESVSFEKLIALENHLVVIKTATYQDVIRIYAITHDALSADPEGEWTLIKKLDAPVYGSQELDNYTHVSGKVFFSFRTYYDDVPPADELWICDGTEEGTKMVKSFPWDPHYYQSEAGMFFNFNEKLFFRGGNSTANALWTSDGTAEGTVKLHDVIIRPPYNDDRLPVAIADDKFYFSGSEQYNAQLWSSDGTTAGTQAMLDVEDDAGNEPHDITIANDAVFFVTSAQFSAALWSTYPAPDIAVTTTWNSPLQSGSTIIFSNEVAKGACATRELNILNKGHDALYLGNIQVTGRDFYLEQQPVGETIAPGETITLQVVFNPVGEGTSRGTLSITSNDADEAHFVIRLKGTVSETATPDLCAFASNDYVKMLEPLAGTSLITLSGAAITEGQPAGTFIGTLSFPQTATFTLTAGEGDNDNPDFYIEGNALKSNTTFIFNLKSVYSLRVKATSQDTVVESSLRIHILNASHVFSGGQCRMTFEQMSFSYTSLEVNAQGHLFAGTSNGRILRSTDAGLHWDVVYTGPAYWGGLSGITFIGDTGFVRSSGGILKSEDGGETWFRLYLSLNGEYYSSPFASFFLTGEQGYAGTTEGEIFFTNDGGRTWETRLAESWNEFRHLFFVSENKGYAVADYGDLLQTVDGGRTWLSIDLSDLGWNPQVQDLWFVDENKGFLLTYNGLYSTADGGQTWVSVSDVQNVRKIKFYDAQTGYLYGANGVFYKTSNGGTTWESFIPGVSPFEVVGVAQTSGKMFIANKDYYYSYESARSFAVSSDEGATWSTLNYYPYDDMYQIRFSDSQKGIVIGEYGLYRTTDNGLTWNQITMDIGSVADLYFINEDTIIFLSGGDLYKSTDGGATTKKVLTTEQNDPYLPAGTLYGFSDDVLFSMSWYAVYRSADLGETWQLVSTNPASYAKGMHFISPMIGYRIDLFGSVEKSIDGGNTWSEVFVRDPEVSDVFNDIFFLNENIGYCGGDYLRKTTDGGVTWEKIDWPFYDIIGVYFTTEDHGYVVQRGGAVYETTNGGVTWQTILYGSTRLYGVQFGDDGIFICGENGFSARMNTTPGAPSQPGYISGPERVCVGDAAEFNVANGTYGTQWTTTATSTGDNSQSITINFPAAGEYTVSAAHFNSCGVSETRTITVVASGHSDLSIEGPSTAIQGEEDVMYTVVNGNENSAYLWEVEGDSVVIDDGNSATIAWSLQAESGVVKVLEVDAAGCRTYDTLAVVLEKPVSVEDELSTYVRVYPNPSKAETYIASAYHGPLHICITDALGKKYFQITLSEGEQRPVPTQHLPAGLYFVDISDGTRRTSRKLIKE